MKSAFEMKHVKKVSVVSLQHNGYPVGKIVANWSDNPAGTVCTATVQLIKCEELGINDFFNSTGSAGGYGYDKLSAAIYSALRNVNLHKKILVESASGNQREAFEKFGYTYIEII